jgi:hypothetical protein
MAQPDRYSANYMMPGCHTVKDTYELGLCHGTLEGIRFMGTPALGKLFCPPEKVVLGQLIRVVVNYIEARPLLGMGLSAAYEDRSWRGWNTPVLSQSTAVGDPHCALLLRRTANARRQAIVDRFDPHALPQRQLNPEIFSA